MRLKQVRKERDDVMSKQQGSEEELQKANSYATELEKDLNASFHDVNAINCHLGGSCHWASFDCVGC